MTWMVQRGLWVFFLSLLVAFPASVCPGWLGFWANPKNTEFTLRNVPLGWTLREEDGGEGNCASPVPRACLKVAVVSTEAACEDLRMFGVSSSGGLFRDHQRAAAYRRNWAADTF